MPRAGLPRARSRGAPSPCFRCLRAVEARMGAEAEDAANANLVVFTARPGPTLLQLERFESERGASFARQSVAAAIVGAHAITSVHPRFSKSVMSCLARALVRRVLGLAALLPMLFVFERRRSRGERRKEAEDAANRRTWWCSRRDLHSSTLSTAFEFCATAPCANSEIEHWPHAIFLPQEGRLHGRIVGVQILLRRQGASQLREGGSAIGRECGGDQPHELSTPAA